MGAWHIEEARISMIILFDSRDLINLLESGNPCTVEECDSILRSHGGSVVITLTHLREIAAPLELAGPGPPVTATLNKLEVLPLTYAEEVTLPPRELAEAISAFRAGREPRVIDPYVERLDAAVPFPVPTRGFVNYPLAEIAWDIWHHNPDTFRRQQKMGGVLRKAVEDRRSRGQAGGDLTEFSTVLSGLAANWSLSLAGLNIEDLARWLWRRSRRCPGILLWFRVRHQIMRNTKDRIKDSDIADLSWTWLLP